MKTGNNPAAENVEAATKCPICGAMVNLSGNMGSAACPICGRTKGREDVQVIGVSDEGL